MAEGLNREIAVTLVILRPEDDAPGGAVGRGFPGDPAD
jgi:hypothetical protein